MANGPGKGTKHHRKPSSIGGEWTARNMVKVPRGRHEAWHTLFSNYEAPTILEHLKILLRHFRSGDPIPPMLATKKAAWDLLFTRPDKTPMSVEEMFVVINETWLDPDYLFIITAEGMLRCIYRPAA